MTPTVWLLTVLVVFVVSLALRTFASNTDQTNAMERAKDELLKSNQDKEVLLALVHASAAVAFAEMAVHRGQPAKKLLSVCRTKQRAALEYAKKAV